MHVTGVERLFLRLPNWLGDSLMARPLLGALRAGLPAARIAACGPKALLELLEGDRCWDAAIPWPCAPQDVAAALGGRPDAALVLPPSFSSAWHAWRTGARTRVGFAADTRSMLLTHAVRRPARGDLHLGREYLALAAPLGVDAGALAVSALPIANVAEVEDPAVRAPSGPYAVLAPGAAYGPAKRWALARWIELAKALSAEGLAVLACGGAGDAPDCEALASASGGRSLAGRTSLVRQAVLCAGAEVVVSNDSGMAHLAGAVGAPTVVIFGSTSSAWTAPLGPAVHVVQRAPVCSPCFRRTCAIGVVCLENVRVADVHAAVERARRDRAKGAIA
ncbi:MAG: lipopolysaccharide heptosyltransferase II [Candidatus Eisenbacteria bacterium]|uniref:lipopolysaccharide heptosyltransferase II n=1 Tax=Eiseniibacteriota bacterium TaxID=2212470 RepID=A0A933SCM4_UNCEI|nr:lipopolysaccharide heptosyltransferase II [Candidatus Eisenbacteria bacterium]